MSEFSPLAPSAPAVFYRSYSRRKEDGTRENFEEAITRTINAIAEIGDLTPEQKGLCLNMGLNQHCFPSGRALWVAGTEWSKKPDNYPGFYNCCSMHVDDVNIFGLLMELAMMGTGTGAVLEQDVVDKLPPVRRALFIEDIIYNDSKKGGSANTSIKYIGQIEHNPLIKVTIGDSRQGWAAAYQGLIELAMGKPAEDEEEDTLAVDAEIILDLSQVRQAGEPLKGFGGTANPVRLQDTLESVCRVLTKAAGRKLSPVECCLLIDEASSAVVAGNIRRSAGMRQFSSNDIEAATAKEGLYKQDENGKWSVDPEKEALRMANHTRCYHHKPEYAEVEDAVRKQFQSGEGAIQYVPEMVARANADLLNTAELKAKFLHIYEVVGRTEAALFLKDLAVIAGEPVDDRIIQHRMDRYGLNPCLTGDAKVLTVHHGPRSFEDLAKTGEDVLVWAVNKETNEAVVRMMRNPRITGYDQPVLEIEFDSGLKVKATHNHSFFTLHRNKVQAKDLKVGQSVAAFAIHQHRDGHLRVVRNNKSLDAVRQQFCHRIIAEYHGIDGEVIHHIDGNPLNNDPLNLEATTHIEHNQEHYANRVRNGFYHGTPGGKARELIANHKVVAVRDAGTATVYNGTVDDFHNYVVVDPNAVGKSYVSGVLSANCGEIALRDNLCNLSEIHLNTISPMNEELQHRAFYAGGLQVAALLKHEFVPERLNYSRVNDPIVGVSFTGLFDFFVHAFGAEWLQWMMEGRPEGSAYDMFTEKERGFLESWRKSAEQGVRDFCSQAGLRVPNRFTTVQPAGSKSLLTGASPGWHPPKAQRFIRRITFGVNDPLVSALRDYGYSVIPAQSARDEQGNLLDDINDPRVREVLVEIPTEVSWANVAGCDQFDLSQLPVSAQWGLYMQVQNHYTTHNTSATLEYRENEIEELSKLIYENIQNDGGYISAALLARFDANETFPRLPFEPIDKLAHQRWMNVVTAMRAPLAEGTTVLDLLKKYDNEAYELKGAAGCDSDKCLASASKDEDQVGKSI
jgi:hypothetical protein